MSVNAVKIAYERGYRCTPKGELLNPKKKQIGSVRSDGYIHFSITIEGNVKSIVAHRLQAYQKFGDIIFWSGVDVRHLNGNKEDFSWDNISIGTRSRNMMDKPQYERKRISEKGVAYRLKYDYKEVFKYHQKHGSRKKTMEHFITSLIIKM